MTKREQFIRFLSIIEKLRTQSEASFNEISEHLKRKSEYSGYDLEISQRGFQRDIKDIAAIFDIEIKNNSSYKYYIEHDGFNDMQERMFEAFDMLHLLNITKEVSSFMHPEKHAGGTENFYGFIHAIKKRLVIKISYQKFWESKPTERYAEPLALKEFRNRWYLLARDRNKNTIKTFGLDRVIDFSITKEKFEMQEKININEMFKSCFGIVMPENQNKKPEKVILSFTHLKGQYFKSLPLHESQQILIDEKNEFRIQLNIYVTHDFIRELLYHSDEMKIISPKSLKKKLNEIHFIALKENK